MHLEYYGRSNALSSSAYKRRAEGKATFVFLAEQMQSASLSPRLSGGEKGRGQDSLLVTRAEGKAFSSSLWESTSEEGRTRSLSDLLSDTG